MPIFLLLPLAMGGRMAYKKVKKSKQKKKDLKEQQAQQLEAGENQYVAAEQYSDAPPPAYEYEKEKGRGNSQYYVDNKRRLSSEVSEEGEASTYARAIVDDGPQHTPAEDFDLGRSRLSDPSQSWTLYDDDETDEESSPQSYQHQPSSQEEDAWYEDGHSHDAHSRHSSQHTQPEQSYQQGAVYQLGPMSWEKQPSHTGGLSI